MDVDGHQKCLLEPLMKSSFLKSIFLYYLFFYVRIFLFKKTKKILFKENHIYPLKKKNREQKKEKETVSRRKISCWKGLIIVLLHGSALNHT